MKDNLKISMKFSFSFFLMLVAITFVAPYSTVYAQGEQGITITGIITDAETGESLPGVNIVIEGTLTGTVSDLSGWFTVIVPDEEAVLNFSFVGYTKKSVTVGKQRHLSVALEVSTKQLEEVVFVGYGVQKKESIVGAISQTTGDIIVQGTRGGDLGNALTGALPGLITIQTTGIPGGHGEDDDYTHMYIRGQKTWNNTEPLVLVDGVERPLHDVNPYEVESVSVLKDASATAVFGVKGANGVILITTKRGGEGKAKLSFDYVTTVKTISRIPERAGSYQANLMKNYAILNEVPVNETSWKYIVPYQWLEYYKNKTYPYYLPDVNWQKEFSKDYAWDHTINMTLTGGTKNVKYFGAISYLHEGDILNLSDIGQGYSPNFLFDRINFRSNMDFNITRSTTFSANLSGYHSNAQRPSGNKWAAWYAMYSTPPDIYPVQYGDGIYGQNMAWERFRNGILAFNYSGYEIEKTTNINTDFMLDQRLDFITKGLSANAKLSYDNTGSSSGPNVDGFSLQSKWISPNIVDEITPGMTEEEINVLEEKYTTWNYPQTTGEDNFDWYQLPNDYGSESASGYVYRSLYYQLSLEYARQIGKHSITGLALMSRQKRAIGDNFPSYREDWVGRITYDYNMRYLFEFNGAYNGSEKFSRDYRFGFFPSMAVGWVVSNEKFFERLKPVVNNLKFRYSDGVVGSDEGIARWLYVGSWIAYPYTDDPGNYGSTEIYRFGAPYLRNAYPLRYEGVIPNPDIQWETSHKRDIGIETGFFRNRLRFTFDYFTEKRTNIFITGADRAVPAFFGATPVSANLGEVDMHGWEFEAHFTHTTAKGFNIWASYAWSFAKDLIIDRAEPQFKPSYQKEAGYQIDQPRVTLSQGENSVMQTWNDIYNTVQGNNNKDLLPGDFRTVDFNSDGVVDENDLAPYGYPSRPQYSYAPSAGVGYKNLSANIRFYGVYNIEGGIQAYLGSFADQFSTVYPWDIDKAYSIELNNIENAVSPALRMTTSEAGGYVDQSRAYLRLQHAEIAYTLISPVIKKVGFSSMRFILSGDNLFLWSKMYEDLDAPRVTPQSDRRRPYPVLKRYNFGLSVSF